MQEKDASFKSGGIDLAGTLTLPDSDGKFPAVLLVAGSGQVDRNENHKKITINAFRDIASYLAQKGIASLRYDKRGVGKSGGDYWSTGFHDNAEDALSALNFLKNQENIQPKRVFILGHSEGAFIAAKLAGNGAAAAGVVLLAGGAQSGEAELKWQAVQVAKGLKGFSGWIIRTFHIDVLKAQRKQLEKIKKTKKDWIRVQLVAKLNVKWFREFLAYDPAQDLAKVRVPVLAITGSKDIQVDPNDLKLMARLVKAPFEGQLVPDLTHLLRTEKGEATVSTYKEQIKRPTEQKVLDLILLWLKRQIKFKKRASKRKKSRK